MDGFTKLEMQAFEAIGVAHPQLSEALGRAAAVARVTGRDNTGHGFYTSFEVDRSQRPLGVSSPLDGATFDVRVGEDTLLMDFLLWFDAEGYPHCLEGYQLSSVIGGVESAERIDLKRHDLATLTRLYG